MRKVLLFLVVFAVAGSVLAAPNISSISPNSCLAGSPQFTLTVNGSGFDNTSKVQWNGAALSTSFISSTQLTAIVPAANVAVAGTANVTVKNSSGPVSNTVIFTINNPVPTITSINPSSSLAGSPQFILTVNGTNFVATSSVRWNGTALTTTFVSSTQLTATVTAALVANAGTASVTVVNPAPGGGTSNAQTFTINNPVPTITSLNPTCAAAGGAQFSLTVNGTNFVSTSAVNWNGTVLAITSRSSTQLTATVTAALIATPGTASITVVNPSPGGGTSNAVMFT